MTGQGKTMPHSVRRVVGSAVPAGPDRARARRERGLCAATSRSGWWLASLWWAVAMAVAAASGAGGPAPTDLEVWVDPARLTEVPGQRILSAAAVLNWPADLLRQRCQALAERGAGRLIVVFPGAVGLAALADLREAVPGLWMTGEPCGLEFAALAVRAEAEAALARQLTGLGRLGNGPSVLTVWRDSDADARRRSAGAPRRDALTGLVRLAAFWPADLLGGETLELGPGRGEVTRRVAVESLDAGRGGHTGIGESGSAPGGAGPGPGGGLVASGARRDGGAEDALATGGWLLQATADDGVTVVVRIPVARRGILGGVVPGRHVSFGPPAVPVALRAVERPATVRLLGSPGLPWQTVRLVRDRDETVWLPLSPTGPGFAVADRAFEAQVGGEAIPLGARLRSLPAAIAERRPVVVDGQLDDWRSATWWSVEESAQVVTGRAAWAGPGDASLRWAVARDESTLFVACLVTDPQPGAGDRLELLWDPAVTVDGRPGPAARSLRVARSVVNRPGLSALPEALRLSGGAAEASGSAAVGRPGQTGIPGAGVSAEAQPDPPRDADGPTGRSARSETAGAMGDLTEGDREGGAAEGPARERGAGGVGKLPDREPSAGLAKGGPVVTAAGPVVAGGSWSGGWWCELALPRLWLGGSGELLGWEVALVDDDPGEREVRLHGTGDRWTGLDPGRLGLLHWDEGTPRAWCWWVGEAGSAAEATEK